MKLTYAASFAAVLAIMTGPAHAALPAARPGPTVNDYTAAQSARAEAAAKRAGFDNLDIAMVQDGNFFLDGRARGQTYSVTVTRDAKVYPSGPSQGSTS